MSKEIKSSEEYSLKLKGSELSIILQLISQQPLINVNELYKNIEKQLKEQVN